MPDIIPYCCPACGSLVFKRYLLDTVRIENGVVISGNVQIQKLWCAGCEGRTAGEFEVVDR